MKENEALDIIKKILPDLQINNHQFIDTGRDYDVIIADNNVFRIPKKTITKEILEKEKKLLDIISNNIAEIEIPTHEIINGEYPFVRMNYVNGKLFSQEIFDILSQNQKISIAKNLADFMRQLHAIPIQEFEEIGYGLGGTDTSWISNMQNEFKTKCGHLLEESILKNIMNYIQDLGTYNHNKKVMTHGDLQGKNIFLNKDLNGIKGIIDFSDARITDPALDFDCYRDFGKDFVELISDHYDGDKDIVQRSDFYRKRRFIFSLMEAVENKSEKITFEIQEIKKEFKNYKSFTG